MHINDLYIATFQLSRQANQLILLKEWYIKNELRQGHFQQQWLGKKNTSTFLVMYEKHVLLKLLVFTC